MTFIVYTVNRKLIGNSLLDIYLGLQCDEICNQTTAVSHIITSSLNQSGPFRYKTLSTVSKCYWIQLPLEQDFCSGSGHRKINSSNSAVSAVQLAEIKRSRFKFNSLSCNCKTDKVDRITLISSLLIWQMRVRLHCVRTRIVNRCSSSWCSC